jgi:hypothetical protein
MEKEIKHSAADITDRLQLTELDSQDSLQTPAAKRVSQRWLVDYRAVLRHFAIR